MIKLFCNASYGDSSKGYYIDGGITYIITYGPPKSGNGTYVITKIEKIEDRKPAKTKTTVRKLEREEVIDARRKYKVEVIRFDTTKEIGSVSPYSDYVRLKITNGSKIVLPTLTVLTKRFDSSGRMVGSSRTPALFVKELTPGQSSEMDYYPSGHLPRVNKVTVEIEDQILQKDEPFFNELKESYTLPLQNKKTTIVSKKQDVVQSVTDYTAISFDTSESELRKKFPRVKCEQMPNPPNKDVHSSSQ